MHNYKRLPMSFLGPKVLKAAALSTLLIFSNAYATGLGKLTVLSSLGQPLRAEIELTSPNKEEINSLVPRVASIEAFRQANIEFNPALLSLRFAVEQRGSAYFIRVSSTQPINEPWVDFLLEMNASSGRLVREYTFLLDPAEFSNGQAAQVVNPATSGVQVKTPVAVPQPAAVIPAQESVQKTAPAVKAEPAKPAAVKTVAATPVQVPTSARQYHVKSGDTLRKIAAMNLAGVSLDEMLVSIYRANPHAFVGDNMNRLKAGQVLTIPDSETIRANAIRDAHAIVQAHSADFNAYRNKLAGQVAEALPEKSATKKQASSGSITSKVKEAPSPANESLDKLKLSKLQSSNAKSAPAKGMSEEDRIAKDKALADSNARVKELEKNVSELSRLLTMQAKSAAVQTSAPVKAPEPKPAEVKASAHAVASIAASASIPAPVVAQNEKKPSAADASAKSASATAESPSAIASASAVSKKRTPPSPPPVVEEPSWFDSNYLTAAALVLLLGGGLGIYSSRKKKAAHQFEDSILTGSSLKANSMFGSTGGQSVDTNNSVFNSNFAPSASQLDANEVDPVAEADVYIAYGRDSQAEEILKEALRTQPDRHAVRLKLLEIYYSRKDQRSFEVFAGELYGMTRGEGEEWAQAASMGISLDPNNPLYAGATGHMENFAPAGLSQPTQPLEDLDPDVLLDNSLSADMLDSISIIDTASAEADESLGGAKEVQLAPEPAPSLDLEGLDFDLGISEEAVEEFPLTLPEIETHSVSKVIEEEVVPTIDFGSIDFDLGGDDVKPEPKVEAALPAFEIASKDEEEHLDLDGLDFVLEEQVAAPAAVEPAKVKDEVEDMESLLDADDALGQLVVSAAEENQTPYNAEMATKLDLAVAYQEIGDKEGARELLDEVLKGGSGEQVEKAKEMLAQLA
ncbi:MAG: FimV family protein [Burkholderiales bacterium]|nr:FimV family protein [Burkholderiales bacterium]